MDGVISKNPTYIARMKSKSPKSFSAYESHTIMNKCATQNDRMLSKTPLVLLHLYLLLHHLPLVCRLPACIFFTLFTVIPAYNPSFTVTSCVCSSGWLVVYDNFKQSIVVCSCYIIVPIFSQTLELQLPRTVFLLLVSLLGLFL